MEETEDDDVLVACEGIIMERSREPEQEAESAFLPESEFRATRLCASICVFLWRRRPNFSLSSRALKNVKNELPNELSLIGTMALTFVSYVCRRTAKGSSGCFTLVNLILRILSVSNLNRLILYLLRQV